MCGVAGTINLDGAPVDGSILRLLEPGLVHRGPDGRGEWLDGNVGLLHRRLSIIDIEGGVQPMTNEDGSIITVFNGEIYNFRQLRRELEAKGHVFATNSDTEVIVHLYEEHGADFAGKLNGMFALAVYDCGQRRLILIRDRVGQKPLHYFQSGGVFAFASELGALSKHPAMPREIDAQAVHDYLSLQYVPCPATVYRGVSKLPPGHVLTLDTENGELNLKPYWRPDYAVKSSLSYSDAQERLRELVDNAVRDRLIADVPLGAFLSGGVDSSIIVSSMTKTAEQPVQAFCIGFDESGYDERGFARAAANHLARHGAGVELREKLVDQDDFQVVEKLLKNFGEPYCDASMIPTHLLSAFTREHVTVALSGDGADELFGGYYRYTAMRLAAVLDRVPRMLRLPIASGLLKFLPQGADERSGSARLRRMLKASMSVPASRYLDIINRFGESLKAELYGEAMTRFKPLATQVVFDARFATATGTGIEKVLETDLLEYLPGDVLAKVDMASMAASLETRAPFLDHRVVEFANTLPFNFKQHGIERKRILRDAFADRLPPETVTRSKMGFGVPLSHWFRGKWDAPLRRHLLEGRLVADGLFRRDSLDRLIADHQTMKADNSYPLWALLVLDVFMQQNQD